MRTVSVKVKEATGHFTPTLGGGGSHFRWWASQTVLLQEALRQVSVWAVALYGKENPSGKSVLFGIESQGFIF